MSIKKSAYHQRWTDFKSDIGGNIGGAAGFAGTVVLVSTVVSPVFFIPIGMAAMIGGAYAGDKILETFKNHKDKRAAGKDAAAPQAIPSTSRI